jgi:peptidoglycan LD-endopeptidase LytH
MIQLPNLSKILSRHSHAFASVLDADLNSDSVCTLDFTASNSLLLQTDLQDNDAFEKAVQSMLVEKNAKIGVGGYFEDRFIYRRSNHFDVLTESRNIHLGIDVWIDAGTKVFSPLGATVHSFQDNDNFGDYGPTIILEHELEGVKFYTLYGHLSKSSLEGLEKGKQIKKGDKIAEVGPYPENGHWPPHLHFQVMNSMEGRTGDFPGVAANSDREFYSQICPNPNLILKCKHL